MIFNGGFIVPLSVAGAGGTATDMGALLAMPVTVSGTGWTTGPVQVSDSQTAFTRTGTDRVTPSGRREIVLVAPYTVTLNLVGTRVGVATLLLLLAPEPRLAGLLAVAGAALLIRAGSRV